MDEKEQKDEKDEKDEKEKKDEKEIEAWIAKSDLLRHLPQKKFPYLVV